MFILIFLFAHIIIIIFNQNNKKANKIIESFCRVSSLLWWCVYWCEGGATCHSHEIHQ